MVAAESSPNSSPLLIEFAAERPITFDPSPLLPSPINVSLDLPANLHSAIESAFDMEMKHTMNDIRNRLLRTVQSIVEQQMSRALSEYSEKVAGCEAGVISARRTILEESVSVNEKFKQVQDGIYQNTQENSRLQEALKKTHREQAQLRKQKQDVDKEKLSLKSDRSRLQSEQNKLDAAVAELQEQRKQVLQWQHLLSQKENSLAEKEAKSEAKSGGLRQRVLSPARQQKLNPMGVPSAADSLEEARQLVEQKAPVMEKYEQQRSSRHAPVPLRMYGSGQERTHRSVSPLFPGARSPSPLEARPGWQ